MSSCEKIRILTKKFEETSKILVALGDESRQHLVLEMMKFGECEGVRVGDITAKTALSRPAVSHHLQILKEAGILKVRKEATKNYYFFDPTAKTLDSLIDTLNLAKKISIELQEEVKKIK